MLSVSNLWKVAISEKGYCTLYTVHCTLYTVHCTLYTVHCTLYTVHCTVHFTLYTVHCTLYAVHCTLYTVHCALYTVNCTLQYTALHYSTLQYTTIHYSTPYTEWIYEYIWAKEQPKKLIQMVSRPLKKYRSKQTKVCHNLSKLVKRILWCTRIDQTNIQTHSKAKEMIKSISKYIRFEEKPHIKIGILFEDHFI